MNIKIVYFLYTSLALLMPACLGIDIDYGTNSASSSELYSLDTTTSLCFESILHDGAISQSAQMSGTGDNTFSQQTLGNGYLVESSAVTGGSSQFSASSSTVTGLDGAFKDLSLAGSGDIIAYVSGSAGKTAADQEALVISGEISTIQSVMAGSGTSISSQSTGLLGETGAIGSTSTSLENSMEVAGGISSFGDINAELTSVAADKAMIYGTTSMLGTECIGNDALQAVSSGELGLKVAGAYLDSGGELGWYGLSAKNTLAESTSNSVSSSTSSTSFRLSGIRWPDRPQIHLLIASKTIPSYLKSGAVVAEISKAANTWDLGTSQDIFRGIDKCNSPGVHNAVEQTSAIPAYSMKNNDKNTIAWTSSLPWSVEGGIIALAVTWYDPSRYVYGWDGDPYYRAVESDIWLNSNPDWGIATSERPSSNGKIDVRTVATHELGHTIGLTDLYETKDRDKIMFGVIYYGQVKWNLRNADKLGLWSLYGT